MNQFTCKELIAMGRHIPTPFSLAVADEAGEVLLRIESLLRIVPGKRIVALSDWKGQVVITKLFFRSGRWKQSMLRDLKGITLLRQAGIPSPKVVSQATTMDRQGAVLLIEYLKQATSLLSLLDDARSDDDRGAVMEMGVAAIARCHQAGLWQKDIHLDNFMLSHNKVYVLDGGDIQGDGKPLDPGSCLQNLAVFFAQFPLGMDNQIPHLLDHYLNAAKTPLQSEPGLAEQLTRRVIDARQQRLRTYERKLFRSTTAHRQVQSMTRFAVYDRAIHSPELEACISDPDRLLAQATMLKEGNASTVARVQFGGRDYVLKRYNVKGFLHGLKRLVQPSRAHKSWRNAATLEMLGIATPHAYLMVEERLLWLFRRRAWYLSEYVDDENLLQQVEQDTAQRLPVVDIVARFKQLFKALQEYHISHGDMKASNFILRDERLYVLDLDAMRRHHSAASAAAMLQKDRERFRRNWDGTHFEAAVQQMLQELEPTQANRP